MRKSIDVIDDEIVRLLKKRQGIVKKIVASKKKEGIPIKDIDREKEIINRLRKLYDDKLVDNAKEMLTTIIKMKPPAAKGTYMRSVFISSTMSPGVKIDPKSIK